MSLRLTLLGYWLLLFLAALSLLLVSPTPPVQAQAEQEKFNAKFPVSFGGGPLCGGENVEFSGTMHVVAHSTLDDNGGTHIVVHTNLQNFKGVGVESGDAFVGRDISNQIFNIRTENQAAEFTQVFHGRLIHQGEDGTKTDDTLFHATFHITRNANGEFTAEFANIVFHCD